jgi:hypothetical protein
VAVGQAVKCDQCGAAELISPQVPASLGWMNFMMSGIVVNLCSFRCAIAFLRRQVSASEWQQWTEGMTEQAANPCGGLTLQESK